MREEGESKRRWRSIRIMPRGTRPISASPATARAPAEGAAVYASVAEPQAGVLAGLAACRPQLGDLKGAASARAALLAAALNFSARLFVEGRPFKFESDRKHLLDGLRKAVLPE